MCSLAPVRTLMRLREPVGEGGTRVRVPLRRRLGGRRARRRRRRVGRVFQVAEYTPQRDGPGHIEATGVRHVGGSSSRRHPDRAHSAEFPSEILPPRRRQPEARIVSRPARPAATGREPGEQRRGQEPDGHEEGSPVLDGLLDAARRGTTTACAETVRTRSNGFAQQRRLSAIVRRSPVRRAVSEVSKDIDAGGRITSSRRRSLASKPGRS